METKSLSEKIDLLFEAHHQASREELREFVQRIHEGYNRSSRQLTISVTLLVIVWLVGQLSSYGAIEEMEVATIKVKLTKTLGVLFPAFLGLLAHQAYTALASCLLLTSAIWRCHKHLLPKAYDLDLVALISLTSFVDLARFLNLALPTGPFGRLHFAWGYSFAILMLLGPVLAIAHLFTISYLNILTPIWILSITTIIGFLAWLHGVQLVIAAARVRDGRSGET